MIAALAALAGFGYVAVQQFPANALPDLLGAAPRPLQPGALHVDDLAADPEGYQGSIVVRGVVARYAPNDANLFALVDVREARLCKSTGCAKFYLPVRINATVPKPKEWDELDVRGQIVADARMTYLLAESVDNLGPMR